MKALRGELLPPNAGLGFVLPVDVTGPGALRLYIVNSDELGQLATGSTEDTVLFGFGTTSLGCFLGLGGGMIGSPPASPVRLAVSVALVLTTGLAAAVLLILFGVRSKRRRALLDEIKARTAQRMQMHTS